MRIIHQGSLLTATGLCGTTMQKIHRQAGLAVYQSLYTIFFLQMIKNKPMDKQSSGGLKLY